jgi:hypothetical protein
MSAALPALSRVAPLLLLAGAIASSCVAVAIFDAAVEPRAANGFVRLEGTSERCEPDAAFEHGARRTIAPEPFMVEGTLGDSCIVWRAHWAVARPYTLEMELESKGPASVLLDGESFLSSAGGRALRSATREVAPGVHPIEVRAQIAPDGGYLRLRMHDRREPYMAGVLPLDRDAFFVSAVDAARALELGGSPRRAPIHALHFALWAALSGLLGWLAIRAWRRRDERWTRRFAIVDLGLSIAITGIALAVRSGIVPETDMAWDELWYWNAGENYVRNAILGDWSAEAFRFNHEHPPIAKWIYGLGGTIGGFDGARHVGCVLSASSVGLTYAIARVLFDRRAAVGAALALAFMPHVVAHGRLVGMETVVVFFWCANLLALAIWMKSLAFGDAGGERLIPGDTLAAAIGGFVFFPGLLSRLTFLWMAVVVFVAVVWARRKEIARGSIVVPVPALIGGAIGLALCIALWPWIHTEPVAQLQRTVAHWGGRIPTEYYLGERTVGPPFAYYPVVFTVTTPILAVIAAAAGAIVGLRDRATRAATVVVLVALLAPFLQGLSIFRQDLARYVIQSWVAIAMLAGVAVSHAGAGARALHRGRAPPGRALPARLLRRAGRRSRRGRRATALRHLVVGRGRRPRGALAQRERARGGESSDGHIELGRATAAPR